jgi:hypothetical protein
MLKQIKLLISVACLMLFVWGCAETTTLFKGNSVALEHVIAITQGQSLGQWGTFDLLLDYQIERSDEMLEIAGQAILSDHYQANYGSIVNLYIYIFFVDDNARVLQNDLLAMAWTSNPDEVYTFAKSYRLPAGATSLAFGYSGSATAVDDQVSFYELPLQR